MHDPSEGNLTKKERVFARQGNKIVVPLVLAQHPLSIALGTAFAGHAAGTHLARKALVARAQLPSVLAVRLLSSHAREERQPGRVLVARPFAVRGPG